MANGLYSENTLTLVLMWVTNFEGRFSPLFSRIKFFRTSNVRKPGGFFPGICKKVLQLNLLVV